MYHSKHCWLPIHNLIKLSSNSLSCIISVLFSVTSDTNWINCSAIQVRHAAWHSQSRGRKHQQTQPSISVQGKMTFFVLLQEKQDVYLPVKKLETALKKVQANYELMNCYSSPKWENTNYSQFICGWFSESSSRFHILRKKKGIYII